MSKQLKTQPQDSESSCSSDLSDCSAESISFTPNVQIRNKAKVGANKTEQVGVKKKKRKKPVSICLTNCRYDIIRKVAQKFNLKEVSDNENWNLYWTDLSISIERCKEMKRFQRINHFPGMLEICRKDLLARNLNRMAKSFPKDYNFFPKTWCFPADLGDALSYCRIRKNKSFILKPDAGSQGRGIYITKTLKDIKPTERMICQVYISRPFLIEGYKFDLRVYTLITSCRPLRVFVYNEGLVRFATSRYQEPSCVNCSNVFMHLTNYAVNKHSRTFSTDDEVGSKRKLSWFNNYMRAVGHDMVRLWQRIDDVIVKTVFSALPILQHSYQACFPNHDLMPACCELLGMDVILDRHLAPQLLEVNHSPSFHTDTALDVEVKNNLLSDMFAMLYLDRCDKRKVIRDERRKIQERLTRPHQKEPDPAPLTKKISFIEYHKHEMECRGGFRLVYPDSRTEHQYAKYMKQGTGSLYAETACSNARQQAAAAFRDDLLTKAKEEAAKRMINIRSRSPVDLPMHKPNLNFIQVSKMTKTISSFEPQVIDEMEEKERLEKLAHRDFLVKSYGLADHIYLLLKQNGALRVADEKKYHQLKQGQQNMPSVNNDNLGGDRRKFNIQDFVDFSDLKTISLRRGHSLSMHRPEALKWDEMKNRFPRTAMSNASKLSSSITKKDQVA